MAALQLCHKVVLLCASMQCLTKFKRCTITFPSTISSGSSISFWTKFFFLCVMFSCSSSDSESATSPPRKSRREKHHKEKRYSPATSSKVDTLRTSSTVHLREVSAFEEDEVNDWSMEGTNSTCLL